MFDKVVSPVAVEALFVLLPYLYWADAFDAGSTVIRATQPEVQPSAGAHSPAHRPVGEEC